MRDRVVVQEVVVDDGFAAHPADQRRAERDDDGETLHQLDHQRRAEDHQRNADGQTEDQQNHVALSGGSSAALGTISGGAQKNTVGIHDVDIGTQKGAWDALQKIDSAIDKVNTARGELGAIQTRFEKTVENIDIQNENLTAARGRVVDADFAMETANLSRTQILQQAGTAMVAQANQLPQQVLSLLR